jgi:hypothetical protein
MGDRLKDLFNVYKLPTAALHDILPPLAAWVAQVMEHARFAGGTQQDAAECLMHILLSMDGGEMQRRVCGASAAASVESMILCRIADEAQVSAMCKTPDVISTPPNLPILIFREPIPKFALRRFLICLTIPISY